MDKIEGIDWRAEQDRFMETAYPRALGAARRAFKKWHSRKRDDAVQECLAKTWDSWIRLVGRGGDPEPVLNGLIKFALLWVRYDRKVAGRAPHPDVYDYRSGMTPQLLDGQGKASPTDRSDPGNAWIDWAVRTGDDPAEWAGALESAGLTSEDLIA